MNYELAKKLKDAGFPIGTGGSFIVPEGWVNEGEDSLESLGHFLDVGAYEPTLLEIIDACGDMVIMKTLGTCVAQKILEPLKVVTANGPTPLIAVANLWLAFNGKEV